MTEILFARLDQLYTPDTLGGPLNPISGNYAIQPTDCGRTIYITGGFANLTLPAITGFVSECQVSIKNADTARGKRLLGFPSDFSAGGSNILWPGQFGSVILTGGAWASGVKPGIYQTSGFATLYVDHTLGSDTTHDCLAPGIGACATIYHAFGLYQTVVKVGVNGAAVIQSDCGFTETPPGAFLGPIATGNGVVFIVGNEAAPETCEWITDGIHVDDGAVVSMRGFLASNAADHEAWISVEKGGTLVYANMAFGYARLGTNLEIFEAATLAFDGGIYKIGIADHHGACAPQCFDNHIANLGGTWELNGATVNIPNVLEFVAFYSGLGTGSRANMGPNTFGGAGGAGGVGRQFILDDGAQLLLNGVTSFPGANLGLVSGGACLDHNCVNVGRPNLFDNLPTCNETLQGAQYTIQDSTTGAWGDVAGGGGGNNVSVQCVGGGQWKVYGPG